jgi:hypothetical protein
MEFGFNKNVKKIVRPANHFEGFKKNSWGKNCGEASDVVESVSFIQLEICETCCLVFKDLVCLGIHNDKLHKV